MQRLGYLKALAALVNENETSNLETLGKRLIARLSRRVRLSPPFDEDLQEYAKNTPYRRTASTGNSARRSWRIPVPPVELRRIPCRQVLAVQHR